MNAKEAAFRLGVSRAWVCYLARVRLLDALKTGGGWVITEDALTKWQQMISAKKACKAHEGATRE